MTAPVGTRPDPTQAAVASTYAAQQEQLRTQLLAALLAIWAATATASTLASPAALFALVKRMVPPTLGAQHAMVALVTAELQQQARQLVGPTGRPITVAPQRVTGAALRQVPIEQVYMRAFRDVQRQLDEGKPPAEAFKIGQQRLEKAAVTDLQLTRTHTARDFGVQQQQRRPDTIVGFRRVLSNKPNHCALCILASTQRYRSFDLMPIHPGCGCSVAMILGTEDPGQIIDPRFAAEIHDVVRRDLGSRYVDPGGRLGLAHYRDILVTNTHGELGPVLGVRDHTFTGPGDIPRLGHVRVNPEGDDIPNN